MTDKTFKENMMLFELTYNLELDPDSDSPKAEKSRAYVRLLRGYLAKFPDAEVRRAFVLILERCKWLPKIADFAEVLKPAGARLSPEAAFSELLSMLKKHGGMYNQRWETTGAMAGVVRNLGGWKELSQLPLDDPQYGMMETKRLHDRFVALYESAQAYDRDLEPGEVLGVREIDWQTGDLKPLTEARPLGLTLPPRRAEIPALESKPSEPSVLEFVNAGTQLLAQKKAM